MKLIKSKRWLGILAFLISSLFNLQNAVADKIKPTIDISQDGFGMTNEPETFLNNRVFEEPVITIFEDAEKEVNITNRFYFSYAMQNGTLGKDSEGKDISTDPVTGTYVYTRYGEVVTGGKAGDAIVCVKVTPIDRFKDYYESAECTYRITLNKVNATAKRTCPSEETWKAANNYTLPYPTFSLSYQNQSDKSVDVSSHYDITASTTSDLITLDETNKHITTKDTEGKANITFHFTPKSDTYEAVADQTVELNIVKLDKITPQLIFPEEGDSAYFGITDWKCLMPKVVDDFGNDLSWMTTKGSDRGDLCLAWGANPLPEGKTLHTTPTYCSNALIEQPFRFQAPEEGKVRQEGGIQVNDFDYLNTGSPAYYENVPRNEFVTYDPNQLWGTAKMADYNSKVYCQLYPNPYKQDIINRFNKVESSYNFKVMTRKSQLVIDPDPRYVKFTQGEKLNASNRFQVNALHVATVDDSQMNMSKGDEFWLRHTAESNGQDGMNYTIKFRSDEAEIIDYGGDPNNIKTITDENGVKYTIFWSTKGYNNDNSWSLTFLKTGKINIEYAVYPWNYHWDGDGYGKTTITYDVIDKIHPNVAETPNPIILYTTDTQLPSQPEVTITDQNGKDIKEYYNVKLEILGEDKHGISESDGVFSVADLTKGEVIVKVIATPKEGKTTFLGQERNIADVYEVGETSFKFIIKELEQGVTRFDWDIIDTQSSNKGTVSSADKDHGKLYFTKEGTMTAGYSIDAIPGLSVKFGNNEDNDWAAIKDESNRIYVTGDVVKISQKGIQGIPVSGTFLELNPHTNGFLTLDAHYAKGNKIVIISANGKERQYFTPSTDLTGEAGNASWQYAQDLATGYPHDNAYKFFRYPLMAGETYYLYNEGNETSREPLHIYGINFLPAFINQQTDHMPITTATAFANGYAGALPMLTSKNMRGTNGIAYKKAGSKKETTRIVEELDEYAEINEQLGTILPKKGTVTQMGKGTNNVSISNHKALSTVEDRIKIYAEVKSNYKPEVVKTPFYDLMISDIPTYIMPDGYVPSIGETVSTTNYKTRIKAYFGGWKKADNRPYFKSNDKEKGALTDSWKISKLDSVGASNRTVDYFTYSSFGGQNATTELVKSYKYDVNNEDLTYQVPCRGTYLRFEPEEKGTLVVYLLQNGMITYDGDKEKLSNVSKNYDKIKISPVYITDEKGEPVTLQPWSISNYDKAAEGTEAFTEGIINCEYNTWKNDCNGGKECSTDNMSATAAEEKEYTLDLLKRLDYVSANSKWKLGDTEQVVDVAKVLEKGKPGSIGYTVLSKAYTRYSFKVEAGKTYFVFMNGSKLGNGGFAFMPDNWAPDRDENSIEVQNVTLDEEGGEKDDLANNRIEDGKTAKVRLYHKFVGKRWNSLCVPFSINQTKFKQIFGDDALAISFDKFEKNDTINGEFYDDVAHFTQHSYHWIVAGRPYLILPGKDFVAKTDESNGTKRQYIEIDSVTIENASQPMHLKEQNAAAEFNFNGNYAPVTLQKGDYAIASQPNGEALLYELPKDNRQKGYRAYIKTTQKAVETGAKLGNFYFGEIIEGDRHDETTGIQPIFDLPEMSGMKNHKNGIYTLDGIKVEDESQLSNLPSDIYIVNGKKVINKK